MSMNPVSLEAAIAIEQQGRFVEAVRLYEQVLAREPHNGHALHLLGVALARIGHLGGAVKYLSAAARILPSNAEIEINLGKAFNELQRHADALSHFDRALALKPATSDVYRGRGIALMGLGRFDQALASLAQAVRLAPNQAQALCDLGVGLERVARYDDALFCFGRASTLDPALASAHHNRGLVELMLRRPRDALASIDRALVLLPRHASVHANRGLALLALSRFEDAKASCDAALAIDPAHVAALRTRAKVCIRLGRSAEALASLERALALDPSDIDACLQRGTALSELGRDTEALASCNQALGLDKNSAEAFNNRGAVWVRLSRPAEALADFAQALSLQPDYLEAYINAGHTQNSLGHCDEAMRSFDRAMSLAPDDPRAAWGKAVLLLAMGRFDRGWPLYESRARLEHNLRRQRNFAMPRWTGAESLAGKTLLIYADQGLGDTLQFCRYIRLLEERGANVVFEVQPVLIKLLGSLEMRGTLAARGEPLPRCDFYSPLLSLPLAFGTTIASIPGGAPYLKVNQAAASAWQKKLAALPGFRVGLNWQGNTEAERSAGLQARSFPLVAAAPLAQLTGVSLVSLQKGAGSEQRGRVDFCAQLTQLTDPLYMGAEELADETAAILLGLDLVITSDTALAHIAGALGVPVWVALQAAADWRWLLDRADSPWYSSMRLFRQRRAGDWSELFTRVAAELASAQSKAPPRQSIASESCA